jgi:hypothetical protein
MLRNQTDTLRGTRDRLSQDRLNQESQRRIQNQLDSLRQSMERMNQTRDHEQSRAVQTQIDRAQAQIRRLEESRLAANSNPPISDPEKRPLRAPARRRRVRRGLEEPKARQVPLAEVVDSGAMAEQRLRMARGIEQVGNFKGALAYFQQVIDKHPGTPQAVSAEQKVAELKQRINYRKSLGLE